MRRKQARPNLSELANSLINSDPVVQTAKVGAQKVTMLHDAGSSNVPSSALLWLVATSGFAALVAVVVRHVVRRKLFGARGDGFTSAADARAWMAAASSNMHNKHMVLHIPRGRGRDGVLMAVLCGDSDQDVSVATVGVAKSNLQRVLQGGGPQEGPSRRHDGHAHARECFPNPLLYHLFALISSQILVLCL